MSQVLVDTSVWIEFFKGNPEFFEPMVDLFEEGEVFSLELVFAELLQGAKSKREREMITNFYRQLRILDHPGLIVESGEFSRKEGLVHKGIGLIDAVIIHAAQKFRLDIWTLDKKILRHLGYTGVFKK